MWGDGLEGYTGLPTPSHLSPEVTWPHRLGAPASVSSACLWGSRRTCAPYMLMFLTLFLCFFLLPQGDDGLEVTGPNCLDLYPGAGDPWQAPRALSASTFPSVKWTLKKKQNAEDRGESSPEQQQHSKLSVNVALSPPLFLEGIHSFPSILALTFLTWILTLISLQFTGISRTLKGYPGSSSCRMLNTPYTLMCLPYFSRS